jgi:SAM-dependent methyltransferase
VLDVGCGRGVWLGVWRELGVTDLQGIDGDHVERNQLQVEPARFLALDVSHPFDLGRRWDLVQCLEVAEHLPPSANDALVAGLTRHGDSILFSAAIPGQGGHRHVNERPLEYWRSLFAARGYLAYDPLRPLLRDASGIEPWYRFNTVLYLRGDPDRPYSPLLAKTRVPPGRRLHRGTPLLWRLRCAALAPLPEPWVTRLAKGRNAIMRHLRGRHGHSSV